MNAFINQLALLSILFFLSGSSHTMHAQTPELDSLMNIIENSTDTTRIDAMYTYAGRLKKSDNIASIEMLNKALVLAEGLQHIRWEAKILNSIGISHGMMSNHAEALELFQKSLAKHTLIKNTLGMASTVSNLGNIYKHMGDYQQAMDAYLLSLEYYESVESESGRASTLSNIAIVLDLTGENEKALEYFFKAIDIYEPLGDSSGLSMTYHNIGLIYKNQGKLDEAQHYLEDNLAFLRRTGNLMGEANVLNSLGQVYLEKGEVEQARNLFLESLFKGEQLNLKSVQADALYNLATLAYENEHYIQATNYLQRHLAIAQEISSTRLQKDAHQFLAKVFNKTDDHKKAFEHLEAALKLKDQLYDEEKTNYLKQWEIRLDVKEKDLKIGEQQKELAWLSTKNKTNKQLRFLLFLALLLSATAGLFYYQKYQLRQRANKILSDKNELIQSQKIQIEKINLDLEKKVLRAQINPHFIFNSLGSIQHFIAGNDRASALKYLSKFSSLLRQVLEESISNTVVLAEEIKLLEIYLELESIRFDHQFKFSIEIDPQLDIYTAEVPVLIVQPFVENAVIHGLLPKDGEKYMHIYFYDAGDFIHCRITDNGIGRSAAMLIKANKKHENQSRGMEVTQQRLEKIHIQASEENWIEFKDLYTDDGQSSGTEVIVKIPKIQ